MRLLLLLSALLTALSGAVGTRAVAQPVQASASASMAAARATAVSLTAVRFAVAAYLASPPRHLVEPTPVVVPASLPLYAERRRE